MDDYNLNEKFSGNSEQGYTLNGQYYSYGAENNTSSYPDLSNSFESGNPVVTKLQEVKYLLAQEVVAKSFLFMFIALLITAFASLTTSPYTAIYLLTGNRFFFLVMAELLIVMVSNFAIRKNIAVLAGVLYVAYSYLTGVTMSVIFMAYTTASITAIFFVTAGMFGIMALYGLATKSDLSSIGSICFMGLIGIIISSLVNMFILRSTMFDTVICGIGVLVFVGLTAYDVQKIKERVSYSNNGNVLTLALYGGFQLYLDFINLFLKLLRLFGKKK